MSPDPTPGHPTSQSPQLSRITSPVFCQTLVAHQGFPLLEWSVVHSL